MSSNFPPSWKKGGLTYGAGLMLETAKRMLAAAEKTAERLEVPMTIAISDSGGDLIAFSRMDNAILCSLQIAMDKAYTAVLTKLPTYFLAKLTYGGTKPLFIHERWVSLPGGFPIIKGSTVLGGIGASGGGAYEDASVARAALKAGGFYTKDADDLIAEIENPAK